MTASAVSPADSSAEVAFATSGHSGAAVTWFRTEAQLRAEALLVAESVPGDVDHVVTFAPPRHLFGRLFGRVLPELKGIGVTDAWRDHLAPPDLPAGKRVLFVCLPSSWVLLHSVVERIRELPGAVALHGTGAATPLTRKVTEALAGAPWRVVEVFGSTETGAVATRDHVPDRPDTPWTLLPDVRVDGTPGVEQPLEVRGPRLGRRADMAGPPASWQLRDVVRFVDDRRFAHLGRDSRLIKVDGVRCDLGAVEAALRSAFPAVDPVCVAVRDRVSAEHYDLFYALDGDGDGDGDGAAPAPRELAGVLPSLLAGVPMPRQIKRVARIPRTITEKVKLDRLYTLAYGGSRTHRGGL